MTSAATDIPSDTLYDRDYVAWADEQAAALRALARHRVNLPLDLENLAEEVEDLGKSVRKAARSQARRAMVHLLKLGHTHHRDPRGPWAASVIDARAEIADDLTATVRRHLHDQWDRTYAEARAIALQELGSYGEHPDLPAICPYTLDQVLAPDWWPPEPDGTPGAAR